MTRLANVLTVLVWVFIVAYTPVASANTSVKAQEKPDASWGT